MLKNWYEKMIRISEKIGKKYTANMCKTHILPVENNKIPCPLGSCKEVDVCLSCQWFVDIEEKDGKYIKFTCKPPTNIPHL